MTIVVASPPPLIVTANTGTVNLVTIPSSVIQIGPQSPGVGGGGITDHGNLTGLSDDDHPQYKLNSSFETDTKAVISGTLVAGANVTLTPTGNDITIAATGGGGGITTEDAVDAVATALVAGNNIDIAYNDALNQITVDVEALTIADVSGLTGALDGKQQLDTDLTAIAGLTATTNNVIQSVSSAWASRTPAQLKGTLGLVSTDVGLGNVTNNAQYYPGGTDVAVTDGGTGASDAATARTNLGIVSGSETAAGLLELATNAETTTGTSTVLATHPAGVKAVADTKQPINTNLTTLGGLTATTDNFIVSVSSAWASRTPAQVKTTLALNNVTNNAQYFPGGTDVAIADGGTGQSTAALGFNALSPMTAVGDLIIGGTAGAGTRLAVGANGHILTLVAGVPAWAANAGGGGGSLTDGDKGDITVSGTGTTWEINANKVTTTEILADAVTYAKIQNVTATDRILGRSTAGAGDIEEITCTSFARSLLDDVDAAAVKTTLALNNVDNTSDANKPVSTAQATADGLRVLKAGDTMTGPLNLISTTGSVNLKVDPRGGGVGEVQFFTNLYVENGFAEIGRSLSVGSDVLTCFGQVIINTASAPAPTAANHLTRKDYVDTQRDTRQLANANLTTLAGLTPTTDNFIVSVSSAWASRTPAQVKTTLALNNVTNNAQYFPGGTDVAVTDGGTGASDAATARTNLGIVSGTETAAGILELATNAETTTGTSTVLAVHPAGVKAVGDTKQPINTNLTTIGGLTATTDNFIVSVSSAWASRTPAQVKTTLALNNVTNNAQYFPGGTDVAVADGGTGASDAATARTNLGAVGSTTVTTLVKLTQAAYDALGTWDSATAYYIVG